MIIIIRTLTPIQNSPLFKLSILVKTIKGIIAVPSNWKIFAPIIFIYHDTMHT
jgi:hypothetical protein